METLINYFGDTPSVSNLLTSLMILGVILMCIEKAMKKLLELLTIYYKKKRGQEQELDDKTIMIQSISSVNNAVEELTNKVEELANKVDQIDEAGQRRDCAILRDRILQACRFFGKNKDESGDIHVGMAEYENLQHLFEEYFSAHGNGIVKKIYEEEFVKWIIDK